MKSSEPTRVVMMILVIVVDSLAGTWAIGRVIGDYDKTVQEHLANARPTDQMKSMCIGRFLIDLPQKVQVEIAQTRIDGFDIAIFDETSDGYQSRLVQREAQLRQTATRLAGQSLEAIVEVGNERGVSGRIFLHGRTITEGQSSDGLTTERYRYEGVAVDALVHAGDISIDLSADYYDADAVSNLKRLIAQLVPNPERRVPSEPGFCLDRVYIRDPLTADQREQIMIAAWLPGRQDIVFRLMLAAGTTPDERGLLERGAASNARLTADQSQWVTRLRGESRTIGGLKGEELIEQFVEENNSTGYSFWWEVNGTEDDVLIPHVVFQMTTGEGKAGPVPTSISEAASRALWNPVSSSIRLRPVAKPHTSHVRVQVAPTDARPDRRL